MANLNETFNVNDLPEGNNIYEPLPAGWYSAIIASAELRPTKAGTGEYIAVRYDITGPTHEGRVVFGNLNIRNPNPKAEEIGRQQLGDLMRSIGLSSVQDTDQLVGGQYQIKLKMTHSEQYGDGNDVSGWKAISGSAPAAPKPETAAHATPAANAPPWAK